MASQQVALKALGLNYSPNTLSLPQGSLVQADDIIIRRDDVIESRRGFFEYSETFGSSTDRAKQLIEYKDRVLVHYSDKIAFDTNELDANGKAIFAVFSGSYLETQAGLRIKSIEANKNLYITTSDGIKKISAKTAADLSTLTIKKAGGIKALDISATLDISQGLLSGFLPPDSAVAYRAVWGYRDANDNLILGVPSNRVEVFNYLSDSTTMDLNSLATELDVINQSTSLITDGDYASSFYTPINADPSAILNNVKQLAIKLDSNILYANNTGSGAPLQMTTVEIGAGGIGRADFASDPTNYFIVGDNIEFSGFSTVPTITNLSITSVSVANPTTITTSTNHGLVSGQTVEITGTNTSASTNGTFIVTVTGLNTFTIPVNVATVTLGTGTVSFLAGSDLTLFNNHFTVLSIDPSGFITFAMPNAGGVTFTATAIDSSVLLNSYNYRNITATGNPNDAQYSQPLDTLELSIPATSQQIRTINDSLSRILDQLKASSIGVIPATLLSTYITPFLVTQSANVRLEITIPTNIDSDYFVQVYRTRIFTATELQTLGGVGGIPVVPDDEMRLVFEAFPTAAEILAGKMIFIDTYPEELVQNNANLYTNPETGEGLIAANEAPPFAKDINRFKNVVFYANTRTKQRLSSFQLLGISNIVSGDKITITSANGSDTYTFVTGVKQVVDVLCTAASTITSGEYFLLYSAPRNSKFAIYYIKDNTGSPPVVADATLVRVDIITGDTDVQVAQKTLDTINGLIYDYQAVENTLPTIRISNINEGIVSSATAGTTPFTVTITTTGNGEDAATKQILLSSLASAAQAITETAQSLVRIINQQTTSVINGYYISGENSPPGQINLEEKGLTTDPFYIMSSNTALGLSFNPDIGPVHTNITSISVAAAAVVTTSTPHGLVNGDQIVITNTDSTPIIDGLHTVTVLSTTTFSVPVTTTIAGTQGSWSEISDTAFSTNDVKPNRVYYSKIGQPEAVPLLNYFDISAEDKEIVRIFPLRDTLFAFKQDGTYRISGEVAPWSVSLLDSSCIVVAPDSVAVTNNIVYAWTTKGITPISETGASQEISRPVDTEILRLSSHSFTNFTTATWGVGYDSDSSYTVYTNSETTDTTATIAFRYCTLTNTWTNFIRNQTCGLNLIEQDVLYMGSGFSNLIHKERKNFDRTDFADKDFKISLSDGNLNSTAMALSFTSVDGINVGDVITQEQQLTTYGFNSLLRQLDIDPTVGVSALTSSSGAGTSITITTSAPHQLSNGNYVTLSTTTSFPSLDGVYQISGVTSTTFVITAAASLLVQASSGIVKRNYESTLEAVSGDNMRDKIVELATYLDTDTGITFTDYSSRISVKTGTITSNSQASPTVVTTSTPHGLIPGRFVTISGIQSPLSIPIITGTFAVSSTGTFGSSTTFTIPKNVTTAGGSGLSFSTAANLNTFEDIKACYNEIVSRLNSDPGVTYSSYQQITDVTLFEAVVLSVNRGLNRVVVNLPLQWIVGPMTVYNAINCQLAYAPITFGDPLMNKQISEATLMFNTRALTKLTVAFSSDLKPEFTQQDLFGQGNGIFGHYSDPGFGYGFFGGASNSAPFRTLIPAQNQRCRFINMMITLKVARESWQLFGVTLTGNIGISARAYR